MADAQLIITGEYSEKQAEALATFDPLRVQQAALGGLFTLLLTDDKKVYVVGANEFSREHGMTFYVTSFESPDTGLGLERITQIAAGSDHFGAVTDDGKLFLWGRNEFGQCGTKTLDGILLAPTRCDSGALANADVRVVFVACTQEYTVALTHDGGVIVFGENSYGQLGTDDGIDTHGGGMRHLMPLRLKCPALDGVRILGCAAGGEFTQLVSEDGRVFAMGRNDHGQLGTGDTTEVRTPTEIDAANFGGVPVAAVSCGGSHTMAITRGEGKLYCWGQGTYGATGLGHWDDATTPQPVVGVLADACVVRISAGMTHSCALVKDGRVFVFGMCDLGLGLSLPALDDKGTPPQLVPRDVLPAGTTVCALATGSMSRHAVFITGKTPTTPGDERGGGQVADAQRIITAELFEKQKELLKLKSLDPQLVFIGSNTIGQCLRPGLTISTPKAARLDGKHVLKTVVGFEFTLMLAADDNQLFAVGSNEYGQLGRGHSNDGDPNWRVLRPVTGFGLERITQIAAGYAYCAAVTEGGKLFLWGQNDVGQCGTGTAGGNVLAATRCDSGALALADVRVVFVACGYAHTVALTSDGGVIVFGENYQGQLGTGNNDDQPTPERLTCAALAGVRIVGCAAGAYFTQLVSDDGRVFAMGHNENGQLGTGDTTNVNTPTEIDAANFGGAPVAAVACGVEHTMAITRGEGKLYCWGIGTFGATGLGHTDNTTTPQPVVSALADARVVRIAAGYTYSYALAEDGRVFACGYSDGIPSLGELGTPQLLQEGALAGDITVRALGTGCCALHAAFITGTPPTTPGDGSIDQALGQLWFDLRARVKEGRKLKLLSDFGARNKNPALSKNMVRKGALDVLMATQQAAEDELANEIVNIQGRGRGNGDRAAGKGGGGGGGRGRGGGARAAGKGGGGRGGGGHVASMIESIKLGKFGKPKATFTLKF